MIQLKTKLLILFFFFSLDLYSQNLYNHDNSVLFGKYLYNSNQFDLAVHEFERCVFIKPNDRESYLYLIKIYRKTNAFEKAVNAFQRLNGNLNVEKLDIDFGTEYFKLLVQNSNYKDAATFLEKNPNFKYCSDFRISSFLLQKKWKDAYTYQYNEIHSINKMLVDIANQGVSLKKKSPLLAGIFSACLPGLGKAYIGRWKDGLISFIMTSSAAFISVRGFNQDRKSFYPWVFSSMAFMYYSGNIYGSTQAAMKYNKLKEDELVNKTLNFVLTNN